MSVVMNEHTDLRFDWRRKKNGEYFGERGGTEPAARLIGCTVEPEGILAVQETLDIGSIQEYHPGGKPGVSV